MIIQIDSIATQQLLALLFMSGLFIIATIATILGMEASNKNSEKKDSSKYMSLGLL